MGKWQQAVQVGPKRLEQYLSETGIRFTSEMQTLTQLSQLLPDCLVSSPKMTQGTHKEGRRLWREKGHWWYCPKEGARERLGGSGTTSHSGITRKTNSLLFLSLAFPGVDIRKPVDRSCCLWRVINLRSWRHFQGLLLFFWFSVFWVCGSGEPFGLWAFQDSLLSLSRLLSVPVLPCAPTFFSAVDSHSLGDPFSLESQRV